MTRFEGTRAAFLHMIHQPDAVTALQMYPSQVTNYRRYAVRGHSISLQKMEELLLRYGASVVQEKGWQL